MFPDLLRDDVFRLETRRLWLRWPRAADAALIAAFPHACTPEAAPDFVLRAREGNLAGRTLSLVLTLKQRPGEPVGAISLGDEDGGEAKLVFRLGEAYCGQGLMREAVEALTGLAFRICDLDAISASVPPADERTARLLASCGFIPAGAPPVRRYLLPRDHRPAGFGAGAVGAHLSPQLRSAIEAGLALE